MQKPIHGWSLYVITDERLSGGRSHQEIAEAAVRGGADVIQLRDKWAGSRRLYQVALDLIRRLRPNGVPLVINDRLDIALAASADGLHVGQEDLPAPVVRQFWPAPRLLGVSAGTVEEAIRAEQEGADYIGVGPIFEARSTKPDAGEPVGPEFLHRIRQNCSLPIVAIGGITAGNVEEVIEAGADCVAVISAVVAAPDIEAAARELKEKIVATKERLGRA